MRSIDAAANGAARERVRAAYSPELFARATQIWAELLTQQMSAVQAGQTAVLNWNEPLVNVARASEALATAPAMLQGTVPTIVPPTGLLSGLPTGPSSSMPDPAVPLERFRELLQLMLARGHNLHHPHYVGHQVPATVPLAGLFDALGSVTNQVMAIYEMGPWGAAVERALVQRLCQAIGWNPDHSAGIVTHGGAAANLTALLAARNVALGNAWEEGVSRSGPPPVLVTQADAHYSMLRAAGIMGIGTNHLIKAALDERRRMDPVQLDETLRRLKGEGHPVIAVVACACATPIGAFDPLSAVADVCDRHQVWFHVDAAHGGAAVLSDRYRSLTAGLERADSVVWDAHKMMFVPALCAFVLYRNREHSFRPFAQEALYLFDPSVPDMREFDGGIRTLECTKRTAAYGLWGLWSLYGPQLLSDLVDVTFDLGAQFHGLLQAAPDFEPLHEPQCNIVVFRYLPESLRNAEPDAIGAFQLRLRREVIQSGEFYLVHNVMDGVPALRVTLINPLTTPDDLVELLQTLRRHGARLLADDPTVPSPRTD